MNFDVLAHLAQLKWIGRGLSLLMPAADRAGVAVYSAPHLSESRPVAIDVVMLHGLGGHHWSTWSPGRTPQQFWPSWLQRDLPVRVLTVGYPTHLFSFSSSPNLSPEDRARLVLVELEACGVGKRPWCLVMHSLGGVVAKQLVIEAARAGDLPLVQALRGMLFIATPHDGSHLANIVSRIRGLPGRDVRYLRKREVWGVLDRQNEEFLATVRRLREEGQPLHLRGMYETLETRGVQVVPRSSALLGMDNSHNDPFSAVGGDHFTCCKPELPTDSVYTRVHAWIEGLTGKATVAEAKPGHPLHEAMPPPSAVLRASLIAAVLLLVGTLLGYRYHQRVTDWFGGRAVRHAAAEYRAQKSRFPSSFARADGTAKSLGEVLLETTPRLKQLHDCLSDAQGTAGCGGIVFVVAAGGVGKGAVVRALKDIPGTASVDLGWVREARRDGRNAFQELGRATETYVNVAGVFSASLPNPDYAPVLEASKGTGGPTSPLSDLEVIADYYMAKEGKAAVEWPSTRTIVIDSFDEVSHSTGQNLLAMASDWTRKRADRSVVFLTRAEALRSLSGLTDLVKGTYQRIPLEPLYVGEGDALHWYVADVGCLKDSPFSAQHAPAPADCQTTSTRRAWTDRLLKTTDLRHYRDFMYAGELANRLLEGEFGDGNPLSPTALLRIMLKRGSERHDRPREGSNTFCVYAAALKTVAKVLSPSEAGVIEGPYAEWEISVSYQDKTYEVPSGSVMEYSSLVDPTATALGNEFRFYPPSLQSLLRCSTCTNGWIHVDPACYSASTFSAVGWGGGL